MKQTIKQYGNNDMTKNELQAELREANLRIISTSLTLQEVGRERDELVIENEELKGKQKAGMSDVIICLGFFGLLGYLVSLVIS